LYFMKLGLRRSHMKTTRTVLALLPLAFVLAACSRNESAARKPSETGTASALPESSRQLLALLPKSNEVDGWSLSDKPGEKPRLFGPGNLWEYIHACADHYLAYGFQEVATADYSQGKTQLTVDVYRMKDVKNAFGIYALERNPDSQFVQVGVEGYLSGTVLHFWAGEYYVKIVAFEEQEAVKQQMLKMASHISGKLAIAPAEPAQLAWFPKANQSPRTAKYIPKDVLGQSYLTNGFETKYKTNDSEYKLVFIEMHNQDVARDAFAKYKQFISNQHGELKDQSVPGAEEGFSGEDSLSGQMMAVRAGIYIVVALGVPAETLGHSAIAQMLNNIRTCGGGVM